MSSPFGPAPKPVSPLGYHRVLSPTAGVKVSPLCLGGMSFGDGWKDSIGECDKQQSFAIMDRFFEKGGNFIDTANNYHYGESEQWIGEWMETRGNRDQIVLATKYTTNYNNYQFDKIPLQSNYAGNHLKSLRLSVERSLKSLRTDYIDLLYIHWWDVSTSVEEMMHGLNNLVASGKVLYLGISDTPAWVVVKANDYARSHGLRPFSVYQGQWNAGCRSLEAEVIPMCIDQGMAIVPWGPVGGGKFKSRAVRAKTATDTGSPRGDDLDDEHIKISEVLEDVADEKGTTLHAVALAYVQQKAPYVVPIVGQRKVEQLEANIEALTVDLTAEDLDRIDRAVPFDPGFAMSFIFKQKYDLTLTAADIWLTQSASHIDAPANFSVIRPQKRE